MTLRSLENDLPDCRSCPRLADYLDASAERLEDGWCRPVPGFGDHAATLLVLGLAPGLRGANRTGRPFTGDAAGQWLYPALHAVGIGSRRISRGRDDDLEIDGTYITNVVKCAPPQNKPVADEFRTCRESWLEEEWNHLTAVRTILALGGSAHREALKLLDERPLNAHPFGHGAVHEDLGDRGVTLVDSYHPSRQNTNTGRLTWEAFLEAVERAVELAGR